MRAPRRHFLFGSLAVMAGNGSPRPSAAASETIILGFMGVRGRGNDLIKYFGKRPDVKIAYLADVDARMLPKRAAAVESMRGQPTKTVQDFRRVLDDKSVDALVIATPDHWHALGTIWACQAGKDVYVEKPTSHSIWESRKMVEAARKHGRVVQVGAQCRSAPYAAAALDYLRSGKLGEVHFVKVFNSKPRSSIGKLPDTSVPAGVDYDMWLGPAPTRRSTRTISTTPGTGSGITPAVTSSTTGYTSSTWPVGVSAAPTPEASPPRAESTSSRMLRRRPIPTS